MTPSARIAAAIEIISDLASASTPVDRALSGWARTHRFAGSKDRRAINARVYDVVRHAHLYAGQIGANDPRSLILASLKAEQLDDAAIIALFDGSKFGPAPLNDDEQTRLGASHQLTDAAAHNMPDALYTRLADQFGDNLADELTALNQRAPTDLRVNTLKASADDVQAGLAAEDVQTQQVDGAPHALRLVGDYDIVKSGAYQSGFVELQDAGSQIVAALCNVKAGEQVIDYCAGAGGKSLAFAAMMENRGQIYAYDHDKRRLGRITARLERAGARNIQKTDEAAKLTEADCVVLDVPCSGSGAWRRNPETRWRFDEAWLDDIRKQQAAILQAGAALVKSGGRLCYITCSVLMDENERQIEAFLAENPRFSVDMIDGALPSGKIPGTVQLTPNRTGTDGFFIARLVANG